jgi:hypothetical protein
MIVEAVEPGSEIINTTEDIATTDEAALLNHNQSSPAAVSPAAAAQLKETVAIKDFQNEEAAVVAGNSTAFIPGLSIADVESGSPGVSNIIITNTVSASFPHLPAVEELAWDKIALLESANRPLGKQGFKFPKENIIVRVGMYGSPNVDHIINEPSVIAGKEIPSLNRYALGYSGGISLGFGVNRLEMETGLIYTSKRYEPIEVQFIAGNVEKGFKNEAFKFFEFNSLSVPVNVKYDFVSKGKWRLYAYAGGALHFTSQAFYHVGTPELSDDNRNENTTYSGRNSVIEGLERGLPDGIFQGGGLRENSYLSVNGGLGVERYLSDRWSFFTQSNYQHTLFYYNGGLGPFKDVLHTFSVSTGLKVRVIGN